MPKIAITNNEERVRQIRLQQKGGTGEAGTVDQGPLLTLPPGVNLVDKALWEEAKKNPNVALLLKTPIPPSPAPEANPERVGKMILVEGKELADENPLRALSERAAGDMIKETLDTNTLRSWLADEARGPVRRAIETQIETIEKPRDSNTPGRGARGRGNRGGEDDQA